MTKQQRIVAFCVLLVVAVAVHFSLITWQLPDRPGAFGIGGGEQPNLLFFRARAGDVVVPGPYGRHNTERSTGQVPVLLALGLGIPAALIGIGAFVLAGAKKPDGK